MANRGRNNRTRGARQVAGTIRGREESGSEKALRMDCLRGLERLGKAGARRRAG
jgi:hypothetical protein